MRGRALQNRQYAGGKLVVQSAEILEGLTAVLSAELTSSTQICI